MKKRLKKMLSFAICVVIALSSLSSCDKYENEKEKATELSGDNWYMGFAAEEAEYPDRKLMMAGYHNGKKYEGILDKQRVNALWVDTGKEGVLFLSVDSVGLLNGTVEKIRNALDDFCLENNCVSVQICSTHTHAGVDTMGLWGEIGCDGKDGKFMESLIKKSVSAAKKAYKNRCGGKLKMSRINTEGLQEDTRFPQIYDSNLYQLHFIPDSNKTGGIRIINYAAHSESLRGENRLISRDYPGVVSDIIKEKTGEDFFFTQGAIGGLITAKEFPEATEGEKFDEVLNMRIMGEKLAEAVLSVDKEKEKELSVKLSLSSVNFEIPLDNTLYMYYKFLGIVDERVVSGSGETGYNLCSECGVINIGDAFSVITVPGEIFPELITGENLKESDPKPLGQVAKDNGFEKYTVLGLCNDSVGYIVPPSAYRVNRKLPYIVPSPDTTGENHYEETNSVGVKAAECLQKAIEKAYSLLKK